MHPKGLAAFAGLALLTTIVPAASHADVHRQTTARRPYIVEVGEPYSITTEALDREARYISELSDYLSAYGYPDYAEIQDIAPDSPWAAYEVRVYYLNSDVEADFGHVILSEATPNLGVRKFVGHIPMAKRHEIEVILAARAAPPVVAAPPGAAAPPATGASMEELVARVEAAADRAAQAANRAAEQSEAAVRSADRTVSILEKMQQSAPAPKHKRPRRARH